MRTLARQRLGALGMAAIVTTAVGIGIEEAKRSAWATRSAPIVETESTAAPLRPARSGAVREMDRLRRLEAAIAARDASRAIYEWREAYGEALQSRRWEALAAVGEAGGRLDTLLGGTGRYRPEAREAYLAALLRARTERSVEGMLRAADGLAALGDTEAARHARLLAGSR